MLETDRVGRGCLSQEIEGSPISSRDGAAGQVCLRERIPGTPQPAGVRPGYKRAAGFLYPLRCHYPRKESEGKSRHDITIENRTQSAAGTAQHDWIPNLNPIGGRISTTQSNKTKIDRVSQPRKNKNGKKPCHQEIRAEQRWNRINLPGNPGGMTMEQSRWNEEPDLKEVQTSEQGHAHLQVICCHSLHEDCLQGEQEICRGN